MGGPGEPATTPCSGCLEGKLETLTNESVAKERLTDVLGVTAPMLVAFGEHNIRSIEDLAACATDDLDGWTEAKDGIAVRYAGILDSFRISRQTCEAIILRARIKAGWIKESTAA